MVPYGTGTDPKHLYMNFYDSLGTFFPIFFTFSLEQKYVFSDIFAPKLMDFKSINTCWYVQKSKKSQFLVFLVGLQFLGL